MSRVVTLLTDFGTADGYVGEVKGVLVASVDGCTIIDISHELPPHDIEAGRLALARYWRRFPVGTIHIAIVDPGVGGERDALAVESEGRMLVGPDNGILSPALLFPGARCVSLPVPVSASPTFHGRDVFAPAAAQLASGVSLDALGAPFATPMVLRTPEAARRSDGVIVGEVISVDRFGNLVTNLMARHGGRIDVAGHALPIHRTYADVLLGDLVALVGSSGLVEIAVREGSAAATLGVERGELVTLTH